MLVTGFNPGVTVFILKKCNTRPAGHMYELPCLSDECPMKVYKLPSVPDFDSKVNWKFWLIAAIESGQVTVDTQRLAPSGPALTSPKFPLKCCVWTYKYWNPGEKGIDQIQLRTLIE